MFHVKQNRLAESAFLTIGSLQLIISLGRLNTNNSQKTRRSVKHISSAITGLPRQAQKPLSETGLPHGETGSALLRREFARPVHPAPMAEPDRATEDMLIRLKSETGFNVNFQKRTMFPPTGGSYELLEVIEVHTGLHFDEDAAIAICRSYMAPADLRVRIDLATMLKVGCKSRGEGDEMTAAQLKFYADALGRYPADVARKAVQKWLETETFFPALAEIHETCKREMRGRDAVETAIRRRHLQNEAKPAEPRAPVTDEFIKAMREKYKIAAPT